jgi:hypothetical protein
MLMCMPDIFPDEYIGDPGLKDFEERIDPRYVLKQLTGPTLKIDKQMIFDAIQLIDGDMIKVLPDGTPGIRQSDCSELLVKFLEKSEFRSQMITFDITTVVSHLCGPGNGTLITQELDAKDPGVGIEREIVMRFDKLTPQNIPLICYFPSTMTKENQVRSIYRTIASDETLPQENLTPSYKGLRIDGKDAEFNYTYKCGDQAIANPEKATNRRTQTSYSGFGEVFFFFFFFFFFLLLLLLLLLL